MGMIRSVVVELRQVRVLLWVMVGCAAAATLLFAVLQSPGWAAPCGFAAAKDVKTRMSRYYKPVKVDATPKMPQYSLPVKLADVTNLTSFQNYLRAGGSKELLGKNGFVVLPPTRQDDIVKFYKGLKTSNIPILVTTDAMLHLYHIQFDTTLKEIEEREFYRDICLLTNAQFEHFCQKAKKHDGALKEVAQRNAAFFAVARILLEGEPLLAKVDTAPIKNALKGRRAWRVAEQLGVMKKALSSLPGGLLTDDERKKVAKMHPYNNGGEIVAMYEKVYKRLRVDAQKLRKSSLAALSAGLKDAVEEELDLIEGHEGFSDSPLFAYKEDYSQYVPRGHYTRSELLKHYFKALMWFGRIAFLIKGGSPYGPAADYLISAEEAKKQTVQACLISGSLDIKASDGRALTDIWERIYSVTAYYVGLADDLTPHEYIDAMKAAFGKDAKDKDLLDAGKFFKFKKQIALLRNPEIYGGTGACEGPPVGIESASDLDKALEKTKGLRLMGQRYIPDSYMMGQLVYPTVGAYTGSRTPKPFTFVMSDGGPIRGFPRGLDVMAVLGSGRALEILKAEGDTDYVGYIERKDPGTGKVTGLKPLKAQFAKLTEGDFNRNLYWSWLWVLKSLLKSPRDYKGCQSFQQTQAWVDKQLNAALGSWAQLRHDTILYAKQSYTMKAGAAPRRPKPVAGYVEPEPEFFARLLALTRMTRKGLDDMKVLSDAGKSRLQALDELLQRVLDILVKEMKNKELSKEDDTFLRNFADQLKRAVVGVGEDLQKTTIIADVHTDQNTGKCLEEGTGCIRTVIVICKLPGGNLQAFAGPAFSYYEFKHPMGDRLTDEKWRQILRGKAPELPDWISSFAVK